ncbi:hypothetical protein BVRB_7g164550 [Beta vulgaris subsp. vulgaris]|nr:hypothetical protein BVRB_7g164550 [Beta vulgaris subsp. vulgaris]
MEIGVEKEMEEKKTEKFEKEKKKNEKEKQEAKKKGKKVVEEMVKPVTKSTRTSQRVRNLKVLNSPSHDEEESIDEDEVRVIAKEAYESCLPHSREQTPVPMETIPPFPSSPPKSASPSPIAPQNNPIPPSTSKPSCYVPKEKETAVVPIPEEQPAVPKSKEHTVVPNPSQNTPSFSQNPTIGSTYTLAHAKRLEYLFTLVMGHSEAMMEFATEAKDLNGLVQGRFSNLSTPLFFCFRPPLQPPYNNPTTTTTPLLDHQQEPPANATPLPHRSPCTTTLSPLSRTAQHPHTSSLASCRRLSIALRRRPTADQSPLPSRAFRRRLEPLHAHSLSSFLCPLFAAAAHIFRRRRSFEEAADRSRCATPPRAAVRFRRSSELPCLLFVPAPREQRYYTLFPFILLSKILVLNILRKA